MTNVKKQNFALPIAIMFSLFFMIAFVTNFAGSMGVIVKNQFGASNALSQLGTLANFIAYACMGIPAGIILKRKGYKFTALTPVIVGFVGVGIQFLSGYVSPSMLLESMSSVHCSGSFDVSSQHRGQPRSSIRSVANRGNQRSVWVPAIPSEYSSHSSRLPYRWLDGTAGY